MSDLIKFEVTGVEELCASLSLLEEKVAIRGVKETLKAAAAILLPAMIARCPVRTGALRDSIKRRMQGIRRGYAKLSVGAFLSKAAGRVWKAKGGGLWMALTRDRRPLKVRVEAFGRYGQIRRGKQWVLYGGEAQGGYIGFAATRDVFYGSFVEFGAPRRGVPAHPFIRPAFEAAKLNASAAMADAMAELLATLLPEREVTERTASEARARAAEVPIEPGSRSGWGALPGTENLPGFGSTVIRASNQPGGVFGPTQ